MKRFRVLQFNMQFGQMWDEQKPDSAPVQLEMTIAEIRRHNADVIMLQEVERAQPGGVQRDPPPNYAQLKRSLAGYDSYFSYPAADPRELPFGIGLAIFSRTPLREQRRLDLPSPPVAFNFEGRTTTPTDRVLIAAKTTIDGREIQLMNTHLLAFFMLGTTSLEHPEQRALVGQQLAACTGPTLLTGDFNVRRHDALIGQFGHLGFHTVQQLQPTWRRQPYVLDHIFYNAALRPVKHQVVPTPVSDHHLLIADFEYAEFSAVRKP
jgi:endonuclease/exonuclease/phosphatase (EEP) superfamily protein YafD